MTNFVKFLISFLAVLAGVVGALMIFDKLSNKNRLKDDYLECDTSEFEEDIQE